MSFDRCMEFVLSSEGDTSDHPSDLGGFTRWGLSSRSYPDLNLATLTLLQAMEIYRRDYWTPIRGDELDDALALVLFDWAVNSGVGTAIKGLQSILGGLKVDGVLGRNTLSAIDGAELSVLICKLLQRRADDRIAQSLRTGQEVFLRGWIRRIIAVGVEALA